MFKSSYYNPTESGVDIKFVKKIIEAHGGKYGCVSKVRVGTDVTTGIVVLVVVVVVQKFFLFFLRFN